MPPNTAPEPAAEAIEVLVVGAGQAGLAASAHLKRLGIPHLVLERARIAERWRSERWDSLVTNGPVWHDRFPDLTFPGDPDAFAPKESVADYFETFAQQIDAPIRTGVEVTRVRRLTHRPGFRVETSAGPIEARYVIAATGPFQVPSIPPLVPEGTGLTQIHSAQYRNPAALPPGGVLVVGAGSSGAQIAEELVDSGRRTFLSVGPHGRPPRSYRGRDFVWWLGVLNKWDAETLPGAEHTTIAVSGAHGGRTVDFRRLAARGLTLLGRTESFSATGPAGTLRFAPDLVRNIAEGDADYLTLLDEADAYILRNALDLPPEPEAREIPPDPACLKNPILSLDLAAEGISTILWATGFTLDFSWLPANALDENGHPDHRRGVSTEPGIYFLGLPWQSRRGSSFIWGVWHDAGYVADHIARMDAYLAYAPTEKP